MSSRRGASLRLEALMHEPLLLQLLEMAERWAGAADCTLAERRQFTATVFAVGRRPEQRTLLAAACEVYDLVAASPEGAQLMRELGLEPLAGAPLDERELTTRWREWCASRVRFGQQSDADPSAG